MRFLTIAALLAACTGDDDDKTDSAEMDTDTDADTDSDTDTDTDADTDADADADTDADTDSDTDTDPMVTNLLSNPGFETTVVDPVSPISNMAITGTFPAGFLWFDPAGVTWPSAETGEMVQNGGTFTARNGTRAMKMFPFFDGNPSVFSVFQEFTVDGVNFSEGDSLTFSAYGLTATGDNISGINEAYITIKFFDTSNGFDFIEQHPSALLNASTTLDVWTEYTTTATIPANATIFQAVFEYSDCPSSRGVGCDDAGSVYWDDATLIKN